MPDLNSDALGIWEHLKPAIDKEIEQKTRGMVQRRKMKVTTAPSISTGTIGVTEAFGSEMVIPFATNLISATVGDMVWVEFMYGATNAFASMFASADEKDWDVAGDLSVGGNAGISGNLDVSGSTSLQNTTVNGVIDVTQRRSWNILSQAGWYRVMKINDGRGAWSFSIDFDITRAFNNANNEVHSVKLLETYNSIPSFANEVSKTNALYVGAIRYTLNSNGVGYVDIRYVGNTTNTVTVDFTVHTNPNQQQYFTAIQLQSVADAPSGETVLTEYTFSVNAVGTVLISNTATSVGGTISVPSMNKYKMLVAHTNTSTSNPIETRGAAIIPPQSPGQVNIPVCTATLSSFIRVQTSGDTLYYTASGISGLYILNLYGIV